MKKRVFASLLALALTLALLPAPTARALGAFADVTDTTAARNVEVLRLMGVLEGDGNGMFRPQSALTRAEFCKMAIELQGRGNEVVRYRSRTIFPDVRTTHWATGYINLASTPAGEKTPALLHGFPDGSFRPDQDISYGEAVAVLARVLGYSDADSGAIWPQGYLDLGASVGLTRGLSLSGGAVISRAQAAQLFVNALGCKNKSGDTLMKLGDEVTLLSVDLARGVLRTTDGKTSPKETEMAVPMASTVLNGLKGRIVFNEKEKAVTFLPSAAASGNNVVADAVIVVTENGSVAGFDALTGNVTDYSIYKNGVRVTAKQLKRYDVATYNAETNTVIVTDTRVQAYYEDCDPSPREPVTITMLNQAFSVVTTARQSMAAFKPGQELVFLLTADGRIAGAVPSGTPGASGNAYAYVDASGKTSLICGMSLIPLTVTFKDTDMVGQIWEGRFGSNAPVIHVERINGGVRGDLDVSAKRLGINKLADNVMIVGDGKVLSPGELTSALIPSSEIRFARANDAGLVDLVVLGTSSDVIFGRVKVWTDTETGESFMNIENPSGTTKDSNYTYEANTGDFAETKINRSGNFYDFVLLKRLEGASASAWIGDTAVNYGGRTYSVPSDVIIYNLDSGTWFKDIETAKRYGGTMNLYVKDSVVRAIEVKG